MPSRQLVTHIAEVLPVRKVTFAIDKAPSVAEREKQRLGSPERRAYSLQWHAQRRREGRKAAGSGVIAPLSYRQQIARDILAKRPAALESAAPYGRKRRK